MGMFDDIKCKYPLPLEGANALDYQTKDTARQYLDKYEIREDGTLWHEDYETEDQSEFGKWRKDHPGEEPPENVTHLLSFAGCMARVNKRWEPVNLTGEIRFYTIYSIVAGKMTNATSRDGWIEWSAYFVDGKLNQLHLVEIAHQRRQSDFPSRPEATAGVL